MTPNRHLSHVHGVTLPEPERTPTPAEQAAALDAAYREMAATAGEQIRAATRLALKQNDGARDLNMWRTGLDRANRLVAAAFSKLHAALASTEKSPAAERGES
jgi:hypothetical protein